MRGYIAIDGPNGCGKTTVLCLVAIKLKLKGFDAYTVREPDDGFTIERFRLNGASEEFLAGAFMMDRAHLMRRIAQHPCDYILSDRSYVSTMVHQSGVSLDFLKAVSESLPLYVDAIFVLVNRSRSQARSTSLLSGFDKDNTTEEDEEYADIASMLDNAVVINVGDMDPEQVADIIVDYIL